MYRFDHTKCTDSTTFIKHHLGAIPQAASKGWKYSIVPTVEEAAIREKEAAAQMRHLRKAWPGTPMVILECNLYLPEGENPEVAK